MAFPTLTAQAPTVDDATGGAATGGATAATSHDVSLPATVNAGDLLLVFGRVAVAGTVAITGGGWSIGQSSADASDDVIFWGYRDTLADGTEDGTTITITHGSGKMVAHTMAIAGAENPATQPPQSSTAATGTSTTPDPTTCTPTGGAKDYLWIWFGGWEGEQTLSKTTPTNYTDGPDISTGTGGAVTSNCQIKTARRTNNAASEDAAAVTISVSDDWTAWVIAVHPAGSSPQNITPSTLATSPTVNSPTIQPGSVNVTLTAELSASATVNNPTAQPGAVTLTPSVLAASVTINAPDVGGGYRLINWDTGDDSKFGNEIVFSAGDNIVTDLTIINSRGDIEAISGNAALSSNSQRYVYLLEGTSGLERAKVLWYGGPVFGGTTGITPQHGIILRHQNDGAKNRGIVIWENIFFGVYWSVLGGVWSGNIDGTGFLNRQQGLQMDSLVYSSNVTASSRTSNSVTLTVGSGHEWVVGDRVNTDLTDGTYDGQFIVSGTSSTTITYPQTAADDVDGGTGTATKVLPYWVEARVNPPESNIIDVRAWNPNRPVPAWTTFDDDAGWVMPGTSGNYLSTPDNAALDITGDICLAADLTATDWTPTANQSIISKFTTTGNQRSYRILLLTTGRIRISWSTDGSAGTVASHDSDILSVSDGQRLAVAVTVDMDNGSSQREVKFWTASTIRGPWTQLGTTQTNVVSSIFSGTSILEGGSVNTTSEHFVGTIHALEVRNGPSTTSTPAAQVYGPNVQSGATSFTCRAGRTWTVNGSGVNFVNTCLPPNATGLAYSADLDVQNTEAVVAANPTPTFTGKDRVGVVVAHLGTDDSARVVYGQLLAGPFTDQIVSPATISASATVNAPEIPSAGDIITPSTLSASATVNSPTVAPGSVNVTPSVLSASATTNSPTVAPGAVNITPNTLNASATANNPTVVPGAVNVTLSVLSASATINSPILVPGAVNITPGVLSASVTVNDPIVSEAGADFVSPNTISVSVIVNNPTLVPGSVNVTPDVLSASAVVNNPVVLLAQQVSVTAAINASATVLQPTLHIIVFANTLNAQAAIQAPVVVPSAVNLTPQLLVASATILAPTVISFASDPYPVEIVFVDSSFSMEYSTASYGVPSLESSGDVAFVEPAASVEYTDTNGTISYTTPSSSVTFTEEGG